MQQVLPHTVLDRCSTITCNVLFSVTATVYRDKQSAAWLGCEGFCACFVPVDVEQAIRDLYDRRAEALLAGLLRVSSSALANTVKGLGDNARVLVGTGASYCICLIGPLHLSWPSVQHPVAHMFLICMLHESGLVRLHGLRVQRKERTKTL